MRKDAGFSAGVRFEPVERMGRGRQTVELPTPHQTVRYLDAIITDVWVHARVVPQPRSVERGGFFTGLDRFGTVRIFFVCEPPDTKVRVIVFSQRQEVDPQGIEQMGVVLRRCEQIPLDAPRRGPEACRSDRPNPTVNHRLRSFFLFAALTAYRLRVHKSFINRSTIYFLNFIISKVGAS